MRFVKAGMLAVAVLGCAGVASAQPFGPGMRGPGSRGPGMMGPGTGGPGTGGPGMMGPGTGGPGAPGPGMMGPGMMRDRSEGPGMRFYSPESYVEGLKAELRITADQTSAWDEYAQAVTAAAAGMRAQHETMYAAMDTATWQERRDMMNAMFQTRQQSLDLVHGAAEKLLPALTPPQRAKAALRLPGLAGPGMMGHGRRGPPPR